MRRCLSILLHLRLVLHGGYVPFLALSQTLKGRAARPATDIRNPALPFPDKSSCFRTEGLSLVNIEQFLATNIYELGKFEQKGRKVTVRELIERYNQIVAAHETDPSLRIVLA